MQTELVLNGPVVEPVIVEVGIGDYADMLNPSLLVLFRLIFVVENFLLPVLILSLGSSWKPSPLNEDFEVKFLNLTDLGEVDASV